MSSNKINEFFFQRTDAMIPLRNALDAYTLRQKVSAGNLANAETPEYRARHVEFEADLARLLDRSSQGLSGTDTEHIPINNRREKLLRLRPKVEYSNRPMNFNGVNNVDVDMEMTHIATNQIHFAAASKVLGVRFSMLQSAIRGTR